MIVNTYLFSYSNPILFLQSALIFAEGFLFGERVKILSSIIDLPKKIFTNPIFYRKAEKPRNEFEANHIKHRGISLRYPS
jgi:hypothetical protein